MFYLFIFWRGKEEDKVATLLPVQSPEILISAALEVIIGKFMTILILMSWHLLQNFISTIHLDPLVQIEGHLFYVYTCLIVT